MPSNGPAEKIIYELKGIPLFTYGMIGITTLVLAYITFTDVEKSTDNVEKSTDNIENPLNPLLQLPTTLSNEVSDLSKEASNIYQNSDLSKTVSNIYQTNPLSNEGEEKHEGQRGGKTEKQKTKIEKQTMKTKKQKTKTKKQKSNK